MPQLILPISPADSILINNVLSYARREGRVYYFQGCMPIFQHAEDDGASFKMILSQFYINGACKQAELVKAFDLCPITLKRWVKKYREEGPSGFYAKRNVRGPHILTDEVLEKAQRLFDEGKSRSEVCEATGVKTDALRKAIKAGKLKEPLKKSPRPA